MKKRDELKKYGVTLTMLNKRRIECLGKDNLILWGKLHEKYGTKKGKQNGSIA